MRTIYKTIKCIDRYLNIRNFITFKIQLKVNPNLICWISN